MDESLQISGAWVNKYTGDVINVHNNIIDGDQMIVVTDHGTMDMNEFSNNYIQASDNIYNEQGQIIDNKPLDVSEITVNKPSLFDSKIGYIVPNVSNSIPKNNVKSESVNKDPKEPESFKILDKFFNKIENKEDMIKIDIDLQILPKEKLNTIIDYMDISIEDLSAYIAKKIINTENLPNIIFNKLQSWITRD